MERTECLCYFAIKGKFDPREATRRLSTEPTRSWSIGDLRKDGSRHEFAFWECGYTQVAYPNLEIDCVQAVQDLVGKESILSDFKSEHDVDFVLEIVPTICEGVTPAINISKDLMHFCCLSDTTIDIDMYVYPFEAR